MYFDLLGIEYIEYIPQGVLSKIKGKSITQNIFRKHINHFIMCGLYFMDFNEYMLAEGRFFDYNNFCPCNEYKKND